MITAALCHVLLPLLQTVCTVAPIKHAPSSYHYPNKIAVPLVLVSSKERIYTSYYWIIPAIMGFRIERDTVKFANYKRAATITTTLWARCLRYNAVF
ncbi:hypothetical protein MRX96_034026 [Rhipicephalus microplus]